MRRTLAAGLTAIAAGGALLVGLVGFGSAGTAADDWHGRIQGCILPAPNVEALMRQEVQDCLLSVMLASADGGLEDLLDMQQALSDHIEERPELYNACHTVGHQAGQRAFEVEGDIVALISRNNALTCQYAIGHGVMDGFAVSYPTDEVFEAAAMACGKLKDDYPEIHTLYGLCADGLGHAAWTSTEDMDDAVERCEMVPYDDGKEYCIEGVVMQIFEPANGAPSETLEDAESVMTAACEDWSGSAITQIGCWRGSSYPFSRPAWRFHYNRGTLADEALNEEDTETMRGLMNDAIDSCQAFSDEGAGHCLKALAQQVPPSVYMDEALTDDLCGRFGAAESYCREFRYKIV